MENTTIYCAGTTASVLYGANILGQNGLRIVYSPEEKPDWVLLDIPSMGGAGKLRSGESLAALLAAIPKECGILGGMLEHPMLEDYKTVDILKNEAYLRENARITAYCALQIISEALPVTFEQAPVLVVGWGRIGKVLTSLLDRLGADVTVAARNPAHIAALGALGIRADNLKNIDLSRFRAIVNTVPASVLTEAELANYPNCAKIDLASVKGLGGPDVIWARGLPGIHAPESSGRLIARTVLSAIGGAGK